MVDLAGMSVDRRHEAARQVMVGDGLSLKQAYEKLVDGSTVENRLLSGEERAIWAAALSDATELALSISPFLSLLRPVYTTSIGSWSAHGSLIPTLAAYAPRCCCTRSCTHS